MVKEYSNQYYKVRGTIIQTQHGQVLEGVIIKTKTDVYCEGQWVRFPICDYGGGLYNFMECCLQTERLRKLAQILKNKTHFVSNNQ